MARLKPSSDELKRIKLLFKEVEKFFVNNWNIEWQRHGKSFSGFDNIHNKNAFYEDVESVIEEKIVKKYGNSEGSEKTISKYSIRRFFLSKGSRGFDLKVLNAFLLLINKEDNWENYKPITLTPKSEEVLRKKSLQKYLLPTGIILCLLLLSWLCWKYMNPTDLLNKKPKITLKVNESVDGSFPKQVNVHYDLKSDKYVQGTFIEYLSKRYYLNKITGDTTLTIPNPQFWKVNLCLGKEILDTKKILLPSNDWLGYLNHRLPLNESDYISDDGELHLLQANKIVKPPGEFYTTFNTFRNFGQDGDDFLLKAKVKNPPTDKNQWAYDVGIDIIGRDGNITFNLLSPDALEYAQLTVADTDFSKKKPQSIQDLGVIIEEYKDLTIRCENKHIQIILDKTVIIDEPYEGEIGQLMGLQFLFKGAGYVKDITLNGTSI
jgi:hypothetical protein